MTEILHPPTRQVGNSADESVRSGPPGAVGDSRPLDPTLDAWEAIQDSARVFQRAIRRAVTVAELVQLRERAEVLSQLFADLSDTAGRRADRVIARRP